MLGSPVRATSFRMRKKPLRNDHSVSLGLLVIQTCRRRQAIVKKYVISLLAMFKWRREVECGLEAIRNGHRQAGADTVHIPLSDRIKLAHTGHSRGQSDTMLTRSNRRQQRAGLTGAVQSRRHPRSSRCRGTKDNERGFPCLEPCRTRHISRSCQRRRETRSCATARRLGTPLETGSVQLRLASNTSHDFHRHLEQVRCQARLCHLT